MFICSKDTTVEAQIMSLGSPCALRSVQVDWNNRSISRTSCASFSWVT